MQCINKVQIVLKLLAMENLPPPSEKLLFSIRLFPEITIKSIPVRKRWTKMLCQNIRALGRQIHERTRVVHDWDRIEVRVPCNRAETRAAFIDLLQRIPGIANFSEITSYPLIDLHDIFLKARESWDGKLVGKQFCVRVKRAGVHDFTSMEVERYVGGGLNQHCDSLGVNLKNPDVAIGIDIKDQVFSIVSAKYQGLGGFPLGSQESVLSLVSGGFDSTVASFQMIRRGMRTHFCFFNLGGREHELAVKEIAYFLWKKYASTHRVRFTTVPFGEVVNEIMETVSPANMGVVLKRMMLRAAERISERAGIEALVTGEAISQVSSQTVPNLAIIDKATNMLVLRPLIVTDKPDIIQLSREIGAEEFSACVPEYCGVISVKPSAKVNYQELQADEARFNFAVLDRAVAQSLVQVIDDLADVSKNSAPSMQVETVSSLPVGAMLIDIRHPNEQEFKPLNLERMKIQACDLLAIPFYKLNSAFATLNQDQVYYLYCDKGVMSALHAAHLVESGYPHVKVFRPAQTDD